MSAPHCSSCFALHCLLSIGWNVFIIYSVSAVPFASWQVPAGLAALAAGKGAEEDDSSSEGSFKAEEPAADARSPNLAAAAPPMTPILGGADALGALTRDLDDRLRVDAWRPAKGPSPWQVAPLLAL